MASQNKTQVDRQKGQPTWGYMIVLGIVAIFLVNLMAISIVILMQRTPERHWVLGIVWAITLLGMTRLPQVRRMIETRRNAPPRRPSA